MRRQRIIFFAFFFAALAFLPAQLRPQDAMAVDRPSPPSAAARGYWLVASDGGVFAFGQAAFFGSTGAVRLNRSIVAAAATPTGRGYRLVAADGGVFAFGDASFAGSTGGITLNRPIVGAAATPSGNGYWLVAADGGIFAFGDAAFRGSTGSLTLASPIVAMAATPSGNGYWLVAADGGVFSFGDAAFHGSAGGVPLKAPIVTMAATPSGRGYWLVASDGGVLTYGDAGFHGSAGSVALSRPVVSAMASPSGRGYWLVASDGGVFAYGDAPFAGSTGGLRLNQPIVASLAVPSRPGGRVTTFYYPWYASQPFDGVWRHWDQGGKAPPADVGADFYPSRGAYSSRDPGIVDAHMADMVNAGINTAIVSWWGRGSWEDGALPVVQASAARHGIGLSVLIEPYADRTVATIAGDIESLKARGLREFHVYLSQRGGVTSGDWAQYLDSQPDIRVWAHTGSPTAYRNGTFLAYAAAARFTGVFTYDPAGFASSDLAGVCGGARMRGLWCSASVGPGYQGLRATTIRTVRGREGGAFYDRMWTGALAAAADEVSITSYNEWHEGTQIEASRPYCTPSGECLLDYEGAYGRFGAAAEVAYLDRTALWTSRYRARAG